MCVRLLISTSSWLSHLYGIPVKDGPRLVNKRKNCRLYIEDGREIFTTGSVDTPASALASKYSLEMASVNVMIFTVNASVPIQ
jgi:hypothetical protein